MKLLRFLVIMVLSFLALPFFPLWGPFACFYIAKAIARRAIVRPGKIHPVLAAFAAQLALFMPIMVSSSGGMSLIFPWWTAFLMKPGDRIDATIGVLSILLFLPISISATSRVRRQMRDRQLSGTPGQSTASAQAGGGKDIRGVNE